MNVKIAPEAANVEADCCGGGAELIPVDLAITKGLALAHAVDGMLAVNLMDARGRVSATETLANYPLPNFNNSAMDGYALNTGMLEGVGPFKLEITGRMAAGDDGIGKDHAAPKGALRILTGALVPDGYDSVIMQENCVVSDGFISFQNRPDVGANIRPAGEDCKPGDLAIGASTMLDGRQIAFAAAQGNSEILVRRKVRVAIFSTGSELKLPGQSLESGQIFNSNRYQLASQLDLPYVELLDLGTIKDDPGLLKDTMEKAAAMADMVITTGGVSVGDEDHMPGTIIDLGGQLHITKVAIKPGKPVTVGTIGSTIFLGLPGNPVAAYVNQLLIGQAIIEKLAGLEPSPAFHVSAIAAFAKKRKPGTSEYAAAKIIGHSDNGAPVLELVKKAGSANLAALAHSDGFVILPVGVSQIERGDVLQFIPH